ncbi:PDZ domain-containing protein [Paenibacillus agilis]|uniref:PDZ domain-containing protein n=1 Tax=Paenibacillus agilis TaxID=3020863 RepID=A0A559IP48_9BACL|nr:PDZ domain-containing protein [Paenibacillus agilis]TVX89424.1 PDZ domain-containing protein [Paenibacillus agilis]
MDLIVAFGTRIAQAILSWLLNPFYWLAVVFIAIQYRRQMLLERRLYAVKMRSWLEQTWRALLGGLVAGIIVSFAAVGLGALIPSSVMILLWILTVVLILFRVRWICLAYAGGVLVLLQLILRLMPDWQPSGWMAAWITDLRDMNAAGLLVIIALVHAAEAWLVRKQAARFASPFYMDSKRGRIVGGYQMNMFWPMPLLLLVPAADGLTLPWMPLFAEGIGVSGWTFTALPIVIGFSDMTYTYLPQDKARVTASRLYMYAAALLAVALLAHWWYPLAPIGALVAIVMHEWLVYQSRSEESGRSPMYTHDKRGLLIQAVLPGSPAEELKLQPGEIITKVNGVPTRTKEELHQALRANAAFCKLEVFNSNGDVKFVQRAMYADEHHQLGVLLAPDNHVSYVAEMKPVSVRQLFLSPWRKSKKSNKRLEQASEEHTLS